MPNISAFVGHSFSSEDASIVREFTDFFDTIEDFGIKFSWIHAKKAEPKEVWGKVLTLIQERNLFIGICTRKETAIDVTQLKTLGNFSYSKSENFSLKTSDWIIQEIGLARGRGMQIILLLEEGVRAPSGLLGDHEYIGFSRDNPAESFDKLMQMIGSIYSGEKRGGVDLSETVTEIDSGEKSGDFESSEAAEEDLMGSLIIAIIENDNKKEEEVADQYLAMKGNDNEYQVLNVEGTRLYYHAVWNKQDNLSKLENLLKANPDHDQILKYVATLLGDYKEHQKAGKYYERAAKNTEDADERVSLYCKAMKDYATANDLKWLAISNTIRSIPNKSNAAKHTHLITIAYIHLKNKDYDQYFAFCEASLVIEPNAHDKRFMLARTYTQEQYYPLSTYHYQILSKVDPTSSVWNNLGVCYVRQELSIKSVEAYREAEKLKSTTAMSNLARRFITAGFIPEAESLINTAQSIPKYDKIIGGAVTELDDTQEKEKEQLEDILTGISDQRRLLLAYAQAWESATIESLEGTFQGDGLTMNAKVESGQFEGVIKISGSEESDGIDLWHKYSGEIKGRSVRFEKEAIEDGDFKTLADGWLVIDEELKSISLVEDSLVVSENTKVFTLLE